MNAKQQRFVAEYLIDLNATQAAIRAGYSEKTARSQGQRLLTNADVEKALAEQKGKRAERTEVTQDYVLTKIKEAVEASATDANQMAVFRGCELLGKHLGMFSDKVIHGGDPDNPLQTITEVRLKGVPANGGA